MADGGGEVGLGPAHADAGVADALAGGAAVVFGHGSGRVREMGRSPGGIVLVDEGVGVGFSSWSWGLVGSVVSCEVVVVVVLDSQVR